LLFKNINIRILSVFLIICMFMPCTITVIHGNAAGTTESAAAANGLAENVQDGQILQCWNWSYNNTKNNMATIAEQGFSAIQTSPIQQCKESTLGYYTDRWWIYYQPANFTIDNTGHSALGTKQQFIDMCNEAHKYGVKVLVDAILNHTGNNTGNDIANAVISDLRNDPDCWHDLTRNTENWSDRWEVTQLCMGGLPDLNTSNSKVQSYALDFLKECIDAGADGFRFDGAKHIETNNSEEPVSSDFWPNVLDAATAHAQSTRGITPYYYGEILDKLGGTVPITAYTQYMSVTENVTSRKIRQGVSNNNTILANTTTMGLGSAKDKAVFWNESHDTYAHWETTEVSLEDLNKTWALMSARKDVGVLYFARPSRMNQYIGIAAKTGWSKPEVKAINMFRNTFMGQSENIARSGNIAYNVRGNSGVVLVNTKGTSAEVNVPAAGMDAGIYRDQITGKIFIVSKDTIRGNIGSTGIAVVYNIDGSEIPMIGDVNLDKNVNIKDATLLQKHIAKIVTLSDAQIKQADADGDGKLNIKDVTLIQKYVAKIINGFPNMG